MTIIEITHRNVPVPEQKKEMFRRVAEGRPAPVTSYTSVYDDKPPRPPTEGRRQWLEKIGKK